MVDGRQSTVHGEEIEYSDTVPIQYQKGFALFMGMEIEVDPRVLIPRPETELLVSVASDMLRAGGNVSPRVLDLCTGSGAVALGIMKLVPGAVITASDISEEALELAGKNIRKFGGAAGIETVVSDMFSAFGKGYDGSFDCIVSNPPYVSDRDYDTLDAWVKAEPRIALYAGENGMDYLKVIAEESQRLIKPGGFVAVEIGYDQAAMVKEIFRKNGFRDVESQRDMNGYERVIRGRKNG